MNLSSTGNNLNLLRLMAALSVVVSHGIYLATGDESAQPLGRIFSHNLGQLAVIVFFFISGLTIAGSLARDSRPASFLAARILRIWPEMLVCLILTIFVLGPLLAQRPLASYFADADAWRYLAKATVLFGGHDGVTGVFTNSPGDRTFNQPLWTLKFEFACYLGLLLLSVVGIFADRRRFLIFCAIYGVFAMIAITALPVAQSQRGTIAHFIDFSMAFVLGAAAWHLKEHLRVGLLVAAMAIAVIILVENTPLENTLVAPVVAIVVLALAALPIGRLRAWTAENDLSYGTYIYGWPITQAIIQLVPGIGWPSLLAIAIPVTLAVAYLSWHLVGKPARHLKGPVLALLPFRDASLTPLPKAAETARPRPHM